MRGHVLKVNLNNSVPCVYCLRWIKTLYVGLVPDWSEGRHSVNVAMPCGCTSYPKLADPSSEDISGNGHSTGGLVASGNDSGPALTEVERVSGRIHWHAHLIYPADYPVESRIDPEIFYRAEDVATWMDQTVLTLIINEPVMNGHRATTLRDRDEDSYNLNLNTALRGDTIIHAFPTEWGRVAAHCIASPVSTCAYCSTRESPI